jgi:hypothetical protein
MMRHKYGPIANRDKAKLGVESQTWSNATVVTHDDVANQVEGHHLCPLDSTRKYG